MKALSLLVLALAAAATSGVTHAQLFINELHYDNDGADANEGVELLGPLSTDLSTYRLETYNGNGGARYGNANYIPAGAALSPVQGSGFGVLWVPIVDLQNGSPDGVALFNASDLVQFLCYEGTFTATSGAAAGTACTDIGVAEPSTAPVNTSLQLTGTGCAYSDFTWTGPSPSSRGALNPGQTLTASCSGTTPSPPTASPPAASPPPPSDPCDPATWTPIYAIQGSGAVSPFVGQVVMTAGYVTASFASDTRCGLKYTLQDAAGDGVAATSDGIYVDDTSANASDVKAGDFLVVRATVREAFTMTQLSSVTRLTCPPPANATSAPVPVELPLLPRLSEQNAVLEKYEGMLVRFPQPLVITETFALGRFGELRLNQNCTYDANSTAAATPGSCANPDRTWTSTQVFSPGPQASAYASAQRQITLDDGRSCQNLTPNLFAFDANNTVRVGDTVNAGLTGVLLYQFNLWRIQPIAATVAITKTNPRPVSPPDVLAGGCSANASAPAGRKLLQATAGARQPGAACSRIVVASANVLNFFNGAVQPNGSVSFCNSCSESPARDNRGASNLNEFYRQRNKTVEELVGLDATVVGLIEIENDGLGNNSAVQNLVTALNAQLPADRQYAVVTSFSPALGAEGYIGTDAISNKIIYRPSRVYPLGSAALLNNTVDPTFAPIQRPTIAQTFVDLNNGGEVTVVVSHLKSKGSSCAAAPYNDPDLNDGAGNCNGVRTAAARAITRWLSGNPTNSTSKSFLLIGDMNAYAQEDAIAAFKAANNTNMLEAAYGSTGPYSYVFGGASGYLDHALANPALLPQVVKVAEWHINADEPEVLAYPEDFKSAEQQQQYYEATPYRSSDHDPVLVGLNLAPRPSNLITVLTRVLNSFRALSPADRAKLLGRLAKALRDYIECKNQPALQGIRQFSRDLERTSGAATADATFLAGVANRLADLVPAAPATC